MHALGAFVRLARLKFLLGGFAGFALGVVVAEREGVPIAFSMYAAGQLMVTAFHLMTHFANDYFDRHTDVRTRPTAFAGGSGVLVRGELAPPVAFAAALVCATIGVLAVGLFAVRGNVVAALLGGAIAVLAWCYSAPPLRLAARGWGELATATVVGILVPLAGYAGMAGGIDVLAAGATLAPAYATFAMMIAVEWPDRDADIAGDKRNLVVRLGSPRAARLAGGCALAIGPALGIATLAGAPRTMLLAALSVVPLAIAFRQRIADPRTPGERVAGLGVGLLGLTFALAIAGYLLPPSSLR